MALLFADSYDHYQTTNLPQKYVTVDTTYNTVVAGAGQCGSAALRHHQTNAGFEIGVIPKLAVAASGREVNLMVAVNPPTGVPYMKWMTVYNGFQPIFVAYINADGSIQGYRNPDAGFPPLAFTSTGGLVPHNELTYVGMSVVMADNDTTGSVEIQINGTTRYTASSLNTCEDDPNWTNLALGGSSGYDQVIYFDSLIVGDGTGSSPGNGLLGQAQVQWLAATGAGATTNFAVTGAANNWNISDNNTPDPSTKYIHSSTVNDVDLYTYANVPTIGTGTIYGVQSSILAAEVSAGTRDIQAAIRQGGVTTLSGTDLGVPVTSFAYLITMMELNPATAAAWTLGQVNGDEYGVKLTV